MNHVCNWCDKEFEAETEVRYSRTLGWFCYDCYKEYLLDTYSYKTGLYEDIRKEVYGEEE